MPRLQANAAIDILTKPYFLHSPKSLSTSAGSGPFAPSLEASLAVLRISLLIGITVGRFMSLVSSSATRSDTHPLRVCTV